MKYIDWMECFKIFAKYFDQRYGLVAAHDEIFIHSVPHDIDETDKAYLESLGWEWHEQNECWHKYT